MNLRTCLLCVLVAGLLAACATRPPAPAAKAAPDSKSARTSAEAASEARIEALSRFANGVSLDMRGRSKEAVEEFRKAALADPANSSLVAEVARRLLRARQVDKAIEILVVAARQPKATPVIHALLGAAYAQDGKVEPAVAALRKALAADPKLFVAYQNLFSLYTSRGKFKEARDLLDEAARKAAPADADGALELVELFSRYAALRPREAEALKPRAMALLELAQKETEPDDSTQLLRVAEGYRSFGDWKRAAGVIAGILKSAPETPGLRERLVDLYVRADEPEKARQELENLVRENPTSPQLYYLLGTLDAEAKDDPKDVKPEARLRRAEENFQKAIRFKADFEPAYFDLAQLRMRLKDYAGALQTLTTARSLFGDTFAVEFYTSLVHSGQKNYPAALKAITAAELIARTSETNRLTTGFYFQLGAVHERSKDYTSAEKYFRKCLELQPDFTEALNYLGYMWAERGVNLKEAQTLIERALKAEPENGAFLDSMAWVMFQQGKAREALGWIEKAVKFTKEPDPVLLDHLGDIYAKLGRREQAREAWKKSLGLEDNPEVRKKLETSGR